MTISKIQYTSRQLAESLVGNPYMAIISITDPGSPPARLDPMFRHVLRLDFFDAVPADEFLPTPLPGIFSLIHARQIGTFIDEVHQAPFEMSLMVHCEQGVSRSAAVALFAEARTGAPLTAREFTYEANPWVIDRFLQAYPALHLEIPDRRAAQERRGQRRA